MRPAGCSRGYHPRYTNTTGTEHWTEADYVNRTMIPDLKDLVTRYRPDVLYTDGEWSYPSDHWQVRRYHHPHRPR